jgi:predicted MFS family arabinose efflux permease
MTTLPTASLAKLFVAWLTMFLVGTELFIFSPLLPMLASSYKISVTVAGLSVAMFSLAYMVSAPVFGHLADRAGRRRVLIYSLLAVAAANLLTVSATTLPSLLAVRVFAGAAAAGVAPSIYALVGDAAPPHRRATWLALVVSGLLTSLALGASAGTLLGADCGWPCVFVALALLALALAGLNRQIWPNERIALPVAETAAVPLMAAAGVLRRLTPTVLWSMGLYGIYTYLGVGLISAGFSSERTAQAIMVYGCGALAGVVIGGRVADRLGAKLTAGASLIGLCACLMLLRLAFDSGMLIEPALGASSAVAQLFFPAQQAGLVNDFPNRRGAALAWNNSALFCGISLGSLVGGGAIALGGFNTNLMVGAGIALIGFLVNAAVVPASATLRRRPRQRSRTLDA